MNKSGFTLVEMLIVVLIIAILSSVALPKYTRSVERARAMEAVALLQQIDAAVYAYYIERQACPTTFRQINVSMPITSASDNANPVQTKHFSYTLKGTTKSTVPDTSCGAALATRINGNDYGYYLWRNYPTSGKTGTLCHEVTDKTKGKQLCEVMDLYTSTSPI